MPKNWLFIAIAVVTLFAGGGVAFLPTTAATWVRETVRAEVEMHQAPITERLSAIEGLLGRQYILIKEIRDREIKRGSGK